jgi:hypothetical protein
MYNQLNIHEQTGLSPLGRIASYELLHQLLALGVVQHDDLDAAFLEVFFTAHKSLVFTMHIREMLVREWQMQTQ